MHSVAIFCGSSPGSDPVFLEQARLVGRTFAESGHRIVYGGGKVGLMGAVADAALAAGGAVIGVIPEFMMPKEVAHEELTELIIVESMTERKLKMHELSDAVITLPGGFGTMEELFEVITWAQLGLIAKPVGLLNVAGYYDPLLAMLDRMVDTGFLRASNRTQLLSDRTVDRLIIQMMDYAPRYQPKWLGDLDKA